MDPDALWAEERPGFLGPRTLPSAEDVDSMLAALHSDQTAAVSAQQVQTVRAALGARGITPEQASRDDVLKAMEDGGGELFGQPVVPTPGWLHSWLGIENKPIQANYDGLFRKYQKKAEKSSARFASKEELAAHIEHVLSNPDLAIPASSAEAYLLIRRDGGNKTAVLEIKPGKQQHQIISAMIMSDAQLAHKMDEARRQGGESAVLVKPPSAEPMAVQIRDLPPAHDGVQPGSEIILTSNGREGKSDRYQPDDHSVQSGAPENSAHPTFLGSHTLPSAEDVDSMLAALRSDQAATVSAQQVQAVRAALDARGITPEQASRDDVLKAMEGGSGAALGQPVNAGVDPGRMVKVVDLAALLGAKRKPSDLIAKLTTIVNQPLDTADAGRIVRVLPENVKHITYSGAPVFEKDLPARNKSIFNLPMLLEHAALVESGPNTKADKKPDVIDYHRFYVPVSDQGKIKVVRIVAHRTKDGLKIDPGSFDAYDVVLESKKGGPHTSGLPHGSPSTASQGSHPLSISIRQMLSGVKDMGGNPYFQPGNGDGNSNGTWRGSYDPVADVIRLFDQADLSTVLHEGGHRWLFEMIGDQSDSRVLPGAKNRIVRDLQTAMDWLGAEIDVATASPEALRKALTVEMHEKWARGVEAYLMEGKAPSAALQQVFERFSAWLFSIYRSLSGLNVELTPEVRGVFDRLLAAEGNEAVQTVKPPQGSKNKN